MVNFHNNKDQNIFSLIKTLPERKALFFGVIATAFEWYEYALFGYFAALIGNLFFPSSDKMTALLYSFAVFASGFAMRPLGAILFGYIGDRLGRKQAVISSLIMMALPTCFLGLLPTYKDIGIIASIMLVIIRLLQGLAIGGNYGGSFIYIIENAPTSIKGFAASVGACGALGGLFLGSAAASLLSYILPEHDLISYGWRIPFIMGFICAVIGYMMRNYIPESKPATKEPVFVNQLPINIVARKYSIEVLKAMGIILLDGVGVYIIFAFMTSFATVFLQIPNQDALLSNTIAMALLVIVIPIFGLIGDKFGHRHVLRYASLGFMLCPLPLYSFLIQYPYFHTLLPLQLIFSVIVGAAYGSLPSIIVGIFPRHIRYTACGLSFNLSVAIFGGTAPFVVTSLISMTHMLLIPAIILSIVGLVSFICLYSLDKEYE